MSLEHLAWITVCIGLIAFLYASVGHAGASGYIAVMTLFGLAAVTVKPAALLLNVVVASIATWQFWRAGHFSWRLFWPFAAMSVPAAFLGGYLNLPVHIFKLLLGAVLWLSAIRFIASPKERGDVREPKVSLACAVGAGLGFLAGCTGTGGGIFLTPLVILLGWARTKTAAAVSAPFILVNSLSGLAGNILVTKTLPGCAWPMVVAAVVCGTAGSYMGSRRFSPGVVKLLLGVVLAIAGTKLLFGK